MKFGKYLLGLKSYVSQTKTGVEIFAIGDHILGIQGHPEYSKDILYNLVDRLANNDTIQVTILIYPILNYQQIFIISF